MKMRIHYGKKITEELNRVSWSWSRQYSTRYEETFSIEKEGSDREIIFGLNQYGEDEIGLILEIWDIEKNQQVFSHNSFDFSRLHGLDCEDFDESHFQFEEI